MYILEPTDPTPVEPPQSMNLAIALALIGVVLTGVLAQPLIAYMQGAAQGFLAP
jgi:hypothetical protein